jgi:hypothetical protein
MGVSELLTTASSLFTLRASLYLQDALGRRAAWRAFLIALIFLHPNAWGKEESTSGPSIRRAASEGALPG